MRTTESNEPTTWEIVLVVTAYVPLFASLTPV